MTLRKDGGMRTMGRGGIRRLTERGRDRRFKSCMVHQEGGEGMARAKKTAGEPKEKKRAGAPPKYATAEALQEKLDAYFAKCEEDGIVPEEFSLGVYLGVSLMTLDNWYNGRRCEYLQETIQMAYMRMSAAAVQMAYRNPKAPMPIFALKQHRYGGYQDKVEAKAEVKVSVKMGENMEASDFA